MSNGAISFQVLAEIASGATARVDLCRATEPDRRGQLLAVKRLHPHLAEDPAFVNQFMDEVWMTASLRHPNVVEVAGWGTDQQGMYLAVELVQGVSLARLMKTVFETGEMFTERMVVFVAHRLCRGLTAAHSLRSPQGEPLNLVHRDLAPGNVLVGFNGDVKIADFGLAKAKLRLTSTITGTPKGHPQYMSPEQALGEKSVDARSDLFSLGVMLFELFTGRPPWVASSEFNALTLALTQPPPDLRELRPKIDKELVAIVMRCLEKKREARFQSAEEVLARFDTWLSVHGYMEGNEETLARFVRRNAMKQMRWFERAVAGELTPLPDAAQVPGGWPQRPQVPIHSAITSAPIVRMPPSQVAPMTMRSAEKPASPDSSTMPAGPQGGPQGGPQRPGGSPNVEIAEAPRNLMNAPAGADFPTFIQNPARSFASELLPPPPQGAPPAARLNQPPGARDPMRPAEGRVEETRGGYPPAQNVYGDASGDDMPTEPLKGAMLAVRAMGMMGAMGSPSPGFPGAVTPPGADVPPQPAMQDPRRAAGLSREALRTEPTRRDTPEVREALRTAGPIPPLTGPGPGVPPAMAASPPPSARPAAAPEAALTKETLRAEADRIVFAAARIGEEARIAAEQAERLATMKGLAERASVIAADAINLLSTAGLHEASRRFDEARGLDHQIQQEAAALAAIGAPPTSTRAPAPPPFPPAAGPTSFGGGGPAIPAQPPAWPGPPRPPGGAPPPSARPRDLLGVRPGAGLAPDASAFGGGQGSMVFGVPIKMALVLATGVIAFLIVLLWILFG